MGTRVLPINLESLIELSARLNETHDINFILNVSLLTLMGKLTISSGCVFVKNTDKSCFELTVSKGRFHLDGIYNFDIQSFIELNGSVVDYKHLYDNGIRYLIPILYHNDLRAVFGLGKRIIDEKIGEVEVHYSNLVASIASNALEVASEHRRLSRTKNKLELRNLTLNTLFEITNDFSSLLSYEQILKLLSYHLMGQLMINKFAIFRVKNETKFEIVLNKCELNIDDELLQKLLYVKSPVVRDNNKDESIEQIFDTTKIDVISPMYVQGEIKGFLFVGKRMSGETFNTENLSFIESLGNIAISALENERLFREELEMKRLESELGVALEIQQGFLPKEFPIFDNLQIFGLSVPSRHVAGDYFDFIVLPNNRIIVVIADVSGKGVAASLIMANVQAALRVVADIDLPLIEIINQLNKIVYRNTGPDKFVTFFIGILDLKNMNFDYINAGHNPPMVFNGRDDIINLISGGLPLGIFLDEFDYEVGTYQLKENDLLVFYTDGITEAQSYKREEYGEERFITVIEQNIDRSPQALIAEVIMDINDFAKDFYQYDDITISAIKYK